MKYLFGDFPYTHQEIVCLSQIRCIWRNITFCPFCPLLSGGISGADDTSRRKKNQTDYSSEKREEGEQDQI